MDDKPWLKMYDQGVPQHIDYPEVLYLHSWKNLPKNTQILLVRSLKGRGSATGK